MKARSRCDVWLTGWLYRPPLMRVLCGYRINESGRRVIVRCTAVSWGRSGDDYRVAETKAGLL